MPIAVARRVFLMAFLIVTAVLPGCRYHDYPGYDSTPPPPPKVDARLISADTRFGLKLFNQLRRDKPTENVFISPVSIALSLAMVYNGASGQTQQALAQALELQGMSLSDVNRANRALLAGLVGSEGRRRCVSMANALWAPEAVSFRRAFLRTNRRAYHAELGNLDLDSPAAAAQSINTWARRETEGKIGKIISAQDLGPQTGLVLTNAVYFQKRWAAQFDKRATSPGSFASLGSDPVSLPMMAQSGTYWYFEDENLQAIRLAYDERRFSMVILLPRESSSLAQLSQDLSAEQWGEWMGQLQEREGTIKLPRFAAEYQVGLKTALQALGMGVAFESARADFAGICRRLPPGGLWVADVKHKASLEVIEEGTTAAAVTTMAMMKGASMARKPSFWMVVDHPFLCAICDDQTGALLFLGAIVDPKKL